MNNCNKNYWYCPSCGNRIYNYETSCSACGTPKVDFTQPTGSTVDFCKDCGCRLTEDFKFCPSCGRAAARGARRGGDSADYEATNKFLKILHVCRGGLFAVILALNAAWCSLFGVFYGLLCIACAIGGIAVQIRFNMKNVQKKSRFSLLFIAVAILFILIAVAVMTAKAYALSELDSHILLLLF